RAGGPAPAGSGRAARLRALGSARAAAHTVPRGAPGPADDRPGAVGGAASLVGRTRRGRSGTLRAHAALGRDAAGSAASRAAGLSNRWDRARQRRALDACPAARAALVFHPRTDSGGDASSPPPEQRGADGVRAASVKPSQERFYEHL